MLQIKAKLITKGLANSITQSLAALGLEMMRIKIPAEANLSHLL